VSGAAPRSVWRALPLHLLLFALTAASVWMIGGPELAVGALSILLAHEMGHYLAARRYGIDATLPYFIPFPFPFFSLIGTLGAVIRIRSPFPDRRALFDVGIAGPLAGFVALLPVLALGLLEAQVAPLDPRPGVLYLGEPLLFQWAGQLVHGPLGPHETLVIGPWGMAAWFGLLVTGLNLMPIGQLDGGHVVYGLFGAQVHQRVSRAASWVCLALLWFGPQWLMWAILMRLLGRAHPATWYDPAPVGRGRQLVGALGALVFVVSFVPDPIQFSWSEFATELLSLF
jgi:membrane-associated protease RseP (regulator of RpoE activity)